MLSKATFLTPSHKESPPYHRYYDRCFRACVRCCTESIKDGLEGALHRWGFESLAGAFLGRGCEACVSFKSGLLLGFGLEEGQVGTKK